MPVFECSSDLGDFSGEIPRALHVITGESDIVVLETWNGCDKTSWDLPPAAPQGRIEIEWLRRKGQFGLDLKIFARDSYLRMGEAVFVRALARALGRPLLFSDCHLFPWSYFMAAADGSIFDVVCEPNEEDRLDLVPDAPVLLFAPSDVLPPPEGETFEPPYRCGVFGGACPKKSDRCVHVGAFHRR